MLVFDLLVPQSFTIGKGLSSRVRHHVYVFLINTDLTRDEDMPTHDLNFHPVSLLWRDQGNFHGVVMTSITCNMWRHSFEADLIVKISSFSNSNMPLHSIMLSTKFQSVRLRRSHKTIILEEATMCVTNPTNEFFELMFARTAGPPQRLQHITLP